jgi:hypothetical protein
MPRLASGLATRARRPRPSEETTSRVISGPSPQGHHSSARLPRRGGLRTAANETLLPPGDRSIRPPGVHLPPVIMICLGLRTALQCGRTECVPPRKPLSALPQGLPRKATRVAVGLVAEGRAPHARKDGITLTRISPPCDHRAVANEPVTVTCPGLHHAFPPRTPKAHPSQQRSSIATLTSG